MKFLAALFLLSISFFSHAQKQIQMDQVKDNIGQTVKLEGKIFGVKTFEDDDKKPTLVNLYLGSDAPNQTLTIAVYPSYKTSSIVLPNESSKGDIAIVTGKIELYKGKPQIVVRSSGQLHVSASDAITVTGQ